MRIFLRAACFAQARPLLQQRVFPLLQYRIRYDIRFFGRSAGADRFLEHIGLTCNVQRTE